MTIWTILLWAAALYLLCGTFGAYMNFRIAKERKEIVEKMKTLRREAFQKGVAYQIEFSETAQKIGFDEEEAIRQSSTLRSPEAVGISDDTIRVLVAVTHILLGPTALSLAFQDYTLLRPLRDAHSSLQRIHAELMQKTSRSHEGE